MPFVAVTRLRVRAGRFLPVFFLHALRTGRQATRADGNLSTAILRDTGRAFWTRTVWRDESAARHYTSSAPHGTVMRRLAGWCDEASVVHWKQETPEPPSWEEAHRRMQRDGRASRVDHPTDAHRSHEIAAPTISRARIATLR